MSLQNRYFCETISFLMKRNRFTGVSYSKMIQIYIFLILTCLCKLSSYESPYKGTLQVDMPARLFQHRHKFVHRSRRQGSKIWNEWSQWSKCSVTCGPGKLTRWRHCISGGCLPGEKEAQLKTCTFPTCQREGGKPKVWDQWGKWSCCTTSCGPGKFIRWRHCVTGGCLPGEKEAQLKPCLLKKCMEDET